MSLVSIKEYLIDAQKKEYAIPLFNTYDLKGAEGLLAAVEEKHAPVIAGIYSGWMSRNGMRAYIKYMRSRAKEASVPIAIMLDHGADFNECVTAIHFGCTDVMYDGSNLPLEENIKNTREIVRLAHAMGVSVEAELGHVGMGTDYEDVAALKHSFTDPDSVAEFVAETGVDSLAVAIGTAHGPYKGQPELDLDLLAELRTRTDVPLVLHGGSGLSDKQFRAAIKTGITKINVATDLYVNAGNALIKTVQQQPNIEYMELTKAATRSFTERCGYYLDLFRTTGKAA